jgi:hypothetical protein
VKPPPEEKLLKLIRGKAPPGGGAPAMTTAAQAAWARPVARASGSRRPPARWPAMVVGALGILLGVEALVLILQLVRPLPVVEVPVIPAAGGVEPTPVPPPQMPSLAASVSRPVFAASTVPGSSAAAPSAAASLLASRLTLMGIVAGEPSQAIIEDAQTKKTFFVTPGQPVVDGAVLERVEDNRAVLNLGGEKIELSL